jgi:hypothetical protein
MSKLTIDILEHESTGVLGMFISFLFVSAVRNALDFPPPEVIFLFHNTWDDIPKSASKSKPKSMSNVM